MAASQVGIFCKTQKELSRPDIQYHLQVLSAGNVSQGLHKFSGITICINICRPKSLGHINIQSTDPFKYPIIVPNYLSHPEDKEITIRSMKITRDIMNTDPISKYVSDEYAPGYKYKTDEELFEGAKEVAQTKYHPVGTCKMGVKEDPDAVVDNRLKVHGIENLRVIDASIMPIITSGNTNAPSIMIADRGADFILNRL